MKTFIPNVKKIKKKWYVVDAKNKILGRLATKISNLLLGKHNIQYSPHIDSGDYVVVINAEKIIVTGRKFTNKIYYRHSGYVGGIKKFSFKEIILSNPEKIIKLAVKGMLPKGPLGRLIYKKMKVYVGNKHNNVAQNPKYLIF